jgi:hypothetical protein
MVQIVKGAFDQATIADVWRKGRVIDGFDPTIWRHDIRSL